MGIYHPYPVFIAQGNLIVLRAKCDVFHLASIFGKLGVSTRTEAVQRGVRLGVIEI